jgi:hypothetical protein
MIRLSRFLKIYPTVIDERMALFELEFYNIIIEMLRFLNLIILLSASPNFKEQSFKQK